MKTTMDISDNLFEETKRWAGKKGGTFKEVVESALRLFLKTHGKPARAFRLRKHTFRGRGLVSGLAEGDWQGIRKRAYEGRGG